MMENLLSSLKSGGAIIAPSAPSRALELAQISLQQMRASVIPLPFIDFYRSCGGAILNDAMIFGPAEIAMDTTYPLPSLTELNRDLTNIAGLRGKTVFGRNSLFWFAFDAFGNCYMMDNVTLNVLRKYDDVQKAISDCLAVGKI